MDKVCSKCGSKDFYSATSGKRRCKTCSKTATYKWRKTRPGREKTQTSNTAWRKANPDKTKSSNATWYKANRGWFLQKSYGISEATYLEMSATQGGACLACKRKDRQLCVDHDHVSGKVRGLLCGQCNRALGLISERADICDGLKNYIQNKCVLIKTDLRPSMDREYWRM